jgi:hypothetical protein
MTHQDQPVGSAFRLPLGPIADVWQFGRQKSAEQPTYLNGLADRRLR